MPDLFNCFEGTSLASIRLAKLLEQKTGRPIKLFYSLPWHAIIRRPSNEVPAGTEYVDFYTHLGQRKANALLQEYGARQSHPAGDRYLIKNLTHSEISQLTLHFNTEQIFVGEITGREYYGEFQRAEALRLIDLLAVFFDNVLRHFAPRVIYDLDTSSIVRMILYLIAKRYGIQYLSLTHSRYEDYVLITKTLGINIGAELQTQSRALNSQQLGTGAKLCREFRAKTSLLNKEEAKDEALRMNYSVRNFLGEVAGNVNFWAFTLASARQNNLSALNLEPGFKRLLSPSVTRATLFNIRIAFRRLSRSWRAPRRDISDLPAKFFYMPLAYVTEGVSPEFSGGWLSDIILLNILRPWIPLDACLLVKEHRAMVPERTSSQAEAIGQIPGVRYIGLKLSENIETNPLKLIGNSSGVICITGTSGLEAAILGKPVLIFGNPTYNQYIGHHQAPTVGDIKRFFEDPAEYVPSQSKVESYISVVIACGARIEYSALFTSNFSDAELDKVAGLFLREADPGILVKNQVISESPVLG